MCPQQATHHRFATFVSPSCLRVPQVSLLPGECFGPNGKGFVRIAFSFSTEDLQRALKAMHEVLEEVRTSRF